MTIAGTKQIETESLPAWMRRRVNLPGPLVGLPMVFTWGPYASVGATATLIDIVIPRHVRPIAFGWYCTGTVSATLNIGMASAGATGGTPHATAGPGTSWLPTSIAIGTYPYGVIYLGTTSGAVGATANYILDQTGTQGSIHASTNPYTNAYTGTASANYSTHFVGKFTYTSGAATDFCCYLLCWPVRHLNDTVDTTDNRIIVAYRPDLD